MPSGVYKHKSRGAMSQEQKDKISKIIKNKFQDDLIYKQKHLRKNCHKKVHQERVI